MEFKFSVKTDVHFGVGISNKLGDFLSGFKASKIMLVTDKGIASTGIVDKIKQTLEQQGFAYFLYDEVEPDPKDLTIEKAVQVYKTEGCDSLLAVGGGSSIDMAKGIGLLANNPGPITNYQGVEKVKNEIPPLIVLPTTAGTGSEVSFVAAIIDTQNKFKMVIKSSLLAPRIALIDPTLYTTAPLKVIASTGMDAFTHAIEAYTSLNAEPFTEALALSACKIIYENLTKFYANPGNITAASQMALASTMAGMAFSSSALGIGHSMAHPLGGMFGVPHGIGNAVLLPHIMELNLIGCVDKYADIAKAMDENLAGKPPMECAYQAIEMIKEMNKFLKIPSKLVLPEAQYSDIEKMTQDTMDAPVYWLNPRRAERQDIIDIYQRIIAKE